MTILAKFRVKPKRYMAAKLVTMPKKIYGRRRPKRECERSDRPPKYIGKYKVTQQLRIASPIKGWTINPDRGPARNTNDMVLLDKPRDIKYGEAMLQLVMRTRNEAYDIP